MIANLPPFRALPVNPKVMQSCGEMGVPRVPKRALTMAQVNSPFCPGGKWGENGETRGNSGTKRGLTGLTVGVEGNQGIGEK